MPFDPNAQVPSDAAGTAPAPLPASGATAATPPETGDQVPDSGQDSGTVEGSAGDGDQPGKMPPAMMEAAVKGAEALFYTSVQIIGSKQMGGLIRKLLLRGNLSVATWTVLDQAMKVQNQQGLPITPPMVIGSVYYIAAFLKSIGAKAGARLTDANVKKATVETIDKFMGMVKGGVLLQKHGRQAAAMRAQGVQGQPPPGGPPPTGGMGVQTPGGGAPQGGMM